MSGKESFEEKYHNHKCMHYLDNPHVENFLSQYLNEKTKRTIIYALQSLFKENEKDNISIDDFVKMSPVDARNRIWDVARRYIDKDKARTATMMKSYATLFYQHINEEKGFTLTWKRNHRIKVSKVREGHTPTHEQIYRLIDVVTHVDTKAMIAISYSSGLKGQGIIGLKVGTFRDALEERQRLKDEFETLLEETSDPEKRKKLTYVIDNLPLYLKITPEIYGKRFTDDSKDWYPAMLCRDAERILMKYYAKHKIDSGNDEPLFTTRKGKPYDQSYLSIKLKSAFKKYYKVNKELGDTSPSLIRRSFYNRLISHGMKDLFREYLMGHTLGVRKHYFNWQSQKLDIFNEYLNCNFNKKNGNYNERIEIVSKDLEKKEKEITDLKKQLEYFQSNDFVNAVATRVKGIPNPFDIIQQSDDEDNTITVEIPLDAGKELAKLLNDGYSITYSNNKIFRLVKEI